MGFFDVFSTILTGAALGFAFGGPFGALIGAGLGAVASATGVDEFIFGTSDVKQPDFVGSQGRALANLDESDGPRRVVYGDCMVGVAKAYEQTLPPNRSIYILAAKICDHPSEEIISVKLNDDNLILGTPDGLVLNSSLAEPFGDVPTNWYVPGISSKYLADNVITPGDDDETWHVACRFYLGGQTAADSHFQSIDSDYGANRIFRGLTYAVFKFRANPDLMLSGRRPQIEIRGRWKNNIYDPRTATFGYTNNAVLVWSDYLMWDLGHYQKVPADLASGYWRDAATVCEQFFEGSTPKYTIDGMVESDEDPAEILAQMGQHFAGAFYERGDKIVVWAGAGISGSREAFRKADVMTLDLDDIAMADESGEAITWRKRLEPQERINTVVPHFVQRFDSEGAPVWRPTSGKEVSATAYVAADGGEKLVTDLRLRWCTLGRRAQYIAWVWLQQHRLEETYVAPFKMRALELEHGDTIRLYDPDIGYVNKQMWVVDKTEDDTKNQVQLVLREYSNAMYVQGVIIDDDFGIKPDFGTIKLAQVTGLAAVEVAGVAPTLANGKLLVPTLVSWNSVDDPWVVAGGTFRVEWKKTTQSVWKGIVVPGNSLSTELMLEEVAYNIRVAVSSQFAARSKWANITFTPDTPQTGPEGPPSSSGLGENVLRDAQVRYELGDVWEANTGSTAGGTVSRMPDVGFHGTGAIQTNITSGAVNTILRFRDQTYYPVLPGQIWNLGASYRRERSKPARLKLRVFWYDSTRTLTGSPNPKVVVDREHTNVDLSGFSDWLDIGGPVMVPAGVAFVRFEVTQYTMSGSFPQTMQFDSMRLERTNRVRGHYASGTVNATTGTWVAISGLGSPESGNLYVRGEVDIHLTCRINTRLRCTSGTTNARSWVEVALVRTQSGAAGDVFNEMIEGPIRLAELPSGVAATGDDDRNPSAWSPYVFDVPNEAVPPGQWLFRILGRVQGNVASITGDFKDRSMRLEVQESTVDTASG